MFTPQQALQRLLSNNELFHDEMIDLMRQIMRGEVAPELIAAILIGLRIKVETVSEISAAAQVMHEFAAQVPVAEPDKLVDVVGTGGVSSSSGSADVMELAGISLALSPEQVGQCIDQCGAGFMFAPNHHSSMKYVAPVRRALGVRTVFNILGPLTNPAAAANQLIGVFHIDLVGILARVFQQLGSKHALVVHGSDGLDEITLTGPTRVAELKDGLIAEYDIHPEQFGLPVRATLNDIKVASAAESLAMMDRVLAGEAGAHRDIVLLNAGATLYAGNVAATLDEGVDRAREAIDSGKARAKREEVAAFSQKLAAQQAK